MLVLAGVEFGVGGRGVDLGDTWDSSCYSMSQRNMIFTNLYERKWQMQKCQIHRSSMNHSFSLAKTTL
ncbi:hypothetical protein QQG55_16415 [Brugia pahangi]